MQIVTTQLPNTKSDRTVDVKGASLPAVYRSSQMLTTSTRNSLNLKTNLVAMLQVKWASFTAACRDELKK